EFYGANQGGLWNDLPIFAEPFAIEFGCDITPTLISGLPSGSAFPIGSTTVTYQADDGNGHVNSCSFNIEVADHENPVINCPSNINLNSTAGICGAVVSYNVPGATDNCTGVTVTQTAGFASGSTFPVGTTVNSFLATDASGNTSTCSFEVTINDNIPPVITCPANISINAAPGQCTAVVNYSLPGVSDECCNAPTSLAGYTYLGTFDGHTYFMSTGALDWPSANAAAIAAGAKLASVNSAAENAFLLGATSVPYFLVGGFQNHSNPNYSEPSGGWEWVDGSPFTYTNWAGGEPSNSGSGEDYIEFYGANQGGLWNDLPIFAEPFVIEFSCNLTPSLISGLASGSVFPSGTTIVTYQANDGNGNTATCSFNVTVNDNAAPVPSLEGLPDVIAQCFVQVITIPTANDNCAGVIPGTTSDPLIYSAEGTYTIHWTYNDGNGNSSSQNQTVIVHDITAPVPNVASLSNVTGQCSAAVTAPIANDNCAGVITGSTNDPLTYNAEGTYTIHWSYNDGHGNISTQNQILIVHDITPPVPNNASLSNVTGQCSATVTTTPKATDNCAGQINGTTNDPLTYNAEGTYTIHWS
ncbi:MAG: HYR domain-containing protein, partial [Bacteroidota bacterium]